MATRAPTAFEAATDAFERKRGGELAGQVIWSIVIAAEPITAASVIDMIGHRDRREVVEILCRLEKAGLIEPLGGLGSYVISRSWWRDLRVFGGHYDEE